MGRCGRSGDRTRWITLGLVLACLGGTLLLGAVHKAPCASGDWSDGRQYRLACYSDIVPLLGKEQLTGDRLPYLQHCAECDEYPVLTMSFMRIAAWISGDDPARFFWVNALLLSASAAVAATCLYLLDAQRALWFALAPGLALLGFVNWDLFTVALAALATLAFFRRRDGWSGALLGLGAAAKLYPAILLLPFVAERLRQRSPDRAIVLTWSAAAAWLAVNLPFAVAGTRGWFEFFRFNGARPADWDSVWYVVCRQLSVCPSIGTINALSLAATLGIGALVWFLKRRREPDFPRWQLAFPLLIVFLLAAKVYSPQFSLWLLPWFVLVLPGPRRFLAFEATDVAVFLTRFSFFGALTDVGGVPQWVFETAVAARAAVLVWCVVAWVREPSRSLGRDGAVAPARDPA